MAIAFVFNTIPRVDFVDKKPEVDQTLASFRSNFEKNGGRRKEWKKENF